MDKNKKLYRSEKNKIIGGVAAGLAEYFEIDPVVVRVFLVVLTLASGVFPMVFAYLIVMVIIPKEGEGENAEMKEKVKEAGEEIKEAAQEIVGQFKEEKNQQEKEKKNKCCQFSSPRHWIGLVFVLVAASMIWNIFSPFYFHIGGKFLLPSIILVFGFFLMFTRSRHER
jgi:phage shock protein C